MIGDNIEADIYGALGVVFQRFLFNYHKINSPRTLSNINRLIILLS